MNAYEAIRTPFAAIPFPRTRLGGGLRALLVTALLILAAAVTLVGAQTPESTQVSLAGREVTLSAIEQGGETFVSLAEAARAVGARLEPRGEDFLLVVSGRRIDFSASLPSMAHGPEGYVSLRANAIRRGRDLFVPVESLGRLLDAPAPPPEPSPAVRPAGGGSRSWPLEEVRVTLLGDQPGSLRLSFDLPSVPRDIENTTTVDGTRRLKVSTGSDVVLPWTSRQIDHDLIRSLAFRDRWPGGFTVEIDPGPGLSHISVITRDQPPGFDVRLYAKPVGRPSPAEVKGEPLPVRRVVLDPGHGGEEEGARGPSGLLEKDVVLDVARRLAARLRPEGFDVVLTRQGDEDLSLDDRAAIANQERADLFISIHANASAYHKATGAETYFLSPEATDDAARTTAALENNAAGVVPDPGTGEEISLILWDLAQVEHLEESSELAEIIQQRFNAALGIPDRGIRQAPFRVLVGATCPAVLVELGFMTNPEEEARLSKDAYRSKLADALAGAIVRFRDLQESRVSPAAAAAQ